MTYQPKFPLAPVHVYFDGQSSIDPNEHISRMHKILMIADAWDGTEGSAKEVLQKIELWLKNSKLPPVIVEVPEFE